MTAMMMDRSAMVGMPMSPMAGNMPMGGMMGGMMPGMMPGMPGMAMPNMMMMPRCSMKMEKMSNGLKMMMTCEDKTSAVMMQNLCQMMAGGGVSCMMMMNGMMMCSCNLAMGMCKVEMTEMGCTMTCTSGDPAAAKMLMACCDCMTSMMQAGCCCCMMMGGMPVCCSC